MHGARAIATPSPADDQALWRQAQDHIAARRFNAARAALTTLLAHTPDLTPARMLLAGVLLALGDLREANAQLCRAAAALPADLDVVYRIAQALSRLGDTNAARACLRHPAITASRSAPLLVAFAHLHQALGLHADALALMQRARALGYDTPDFRYQLGLQLQFNGRLAEAETQMTDCLRMGSTIGRAALSLSRIRRQTATSNHVDALRARMASTEPGSEDHASLAFALHKELDDLGHYEDAWDALETGNDIMRKRMSPYDPAAQSALFDAVVAHFDAAPPTHAPPQPDGPMPIFVVGLPRSGTSLLESMLGGHSMVAPAGELNDFPRQLRRAANCHGQAVLDAQLLARASALDSADLGRRYLEQSRWRANGARYYVDKLPPNFMLLGFIRRALPQARVIHMVREPMDVCFSNYRAMFGAAYGYSYGLDTLAHHHAQYARLMRHWQRALPGFVLDVSYDALVRETETQCRSLLDFCGLRFEAACLDNTRNTAAVATLSSAQVREPIHARARGAWRRYARQLAALRTMLGEPG